MISVNLLPREERVEQLDLAAPPRMKVLLPLAVAIGLLVPAGALFLTQESKIQGLRREIQIAEQETRNLQPRIELLDALRDKRAQLSERLDLVVGLNQQRVLPVRLMDAVSLRLPDHMWLTRMQESAAGGLTFDGYTFSNLVVAELMTRLEASALYRDIELQVASREHLGDDPVVRFTVTAGIDATP